MRALWLGALLIAVMLVAGCTRAGDTSSPGDGLHQTAPSVVGMTVDQATTELEEAGYEVGQVTAQASEGATSGAVISQDPVAGTSVPRGGAIDLVTAE